MSSVDSRIVTMKFDNAQFQQGAATTLSTLDKLKQSMNFTTVTSAASRSLGTISSVLNRIGFRNPFTSMLSTASRGLGILSAGFARFGSKNHFAGAEQGAAELGRAAQQAGTVGMGSLEGGVTGVSKSFIAMSTIAITALSNITNRAVNAGLAFGKSFTFAPVMDGLREYELNLKSMQTVQANTDQPLSKVEESLDELNKYSDQTIYNFAEMARNVGTFTAAGVDLETSVSSIKGIANMAALSGSSSEQAAGAMYQLSQAIAAGKVGLMDWNSVVNAGMGGKKLQGALAQTAIAMGRINAEQVKGVESGEQLTIMGQSFRESISAATGEEAWLSSDVLTNSLAALDGRYSAAALSAEKLANGTLKYKNAAEVATAIDKARAKAAKDGIVYTDEQFKELQKLSTAAFESATKVKTLGQVFDIAKETIASGWSASFRSIFGNLNEAKKLFTGMSEGLNAIIEQNALARNELLAKWKEGEGRLMLIDALKAGWESISSILGAVGKGFRDIFPKMEAERLIELTARFSSFMASLIPGKKTLNDIRATAAAVFAIFSIVGQVLSAVVDQVIRLVSSASDGAGGFLEITASVGDAIVNFDAFLEKSGALEQFFGGLGDILAIPLELLASFVGLIGNLFVGYNDTAATKVTGAVDAFGNALTPLQSLVQSLGSVFEYVGLLLGSIAGHIVNALSGIGDVISNAITPDTFDATLDAINTGLFAALVLMIRRFVNDGFSVDFGGGMFESIKESLDAATGALVTMQTNLKADILMKIAAALGILSVALLLLASINGRELAKALTGMTVGFIGLSTVLLYLSTAVSLIGAAKLPLISASMTLLAGSILVLALALKVMASISFGNMLRGLVGLGAMLFIIQKAMGPLTANYKGMLRVSAALILLGIALNLMAGALKIFATMSWEEMAKGLTAVVSLLAILAVAMRLLPDMKADATAMVLLAVSINLLAVALKIFATMSWDEIGRGLTTLAGSLVAIAAAMRLMPKGMLLQSAALVAVGLALNVIGAAIKGMSSLGWDEIARGLVTLGGSLAIIAVALNLMKGTLLGAAALVVATGALALLTPILITLGTLDWGTIVKGLTAMAGIFAILGISGLLLAPLVPVILGLSLAMTLIGNGLMLAGVGALAFAAAFGIVVATGAAGVEVLVGMLAAVIATIPKAMAAFGKGVVEFVKAIAAGGPAFVAAVSKIISNILDAIIENVPKMGRAFMVLLNTGLRVIVSSTPKIIAAGFKLIIGFLSAIEKNIGKIVNITSNIIVKFLDGIARNLPRIIQSGVNLIIRFVEGLSRAIDNNSERMGAAGVDLAGSIIKGMVSGMMGGIGAIKDAAVEAAKGALSAAKEFLSINSPSKKFRDEVGSAIPEGMADGIKRETPMVSRSVETMGRSALDTMKRTMSKVSDSFAMDNDITPRITPVLDLSQVTRDASRMSGILATSPVKASVSYGRAADISMETEATREAAYEASMEPSVTEIKLEQNNYSPKPIDPIVTYRNTKSLLSLTKEALSTP